MRIRAGLLMIGFICEAATEKINELEKEDYKPKIKEKISYTEWKVKKLIEDYLIDNVMSKSDEDVILWCNDRCMNDTTIMNAIIKTAVEKWIEYKAETAE